MLTFSLFYLNFKNYYGYINKIINVYISCCFKIVLPKINTKSLLKARLHCKIALVFKSCITFLY